MTLPIARIFVLSPLERVSEITCGLIMVMSFTGALSVAHAGAADVQRMLIAAILRNLTWGIIDAVFYLIGCLAEYSRGVMLLVGIQQSTEPARAQQTIASVLPAKIAGVLRPEHYDYIHTHRRG